MVVHQIRYYGKSVKVIVEHPDGGQLSLPASETSLELPKPYPQMVGKTPLFTPDKLLRLVQVVATLDLDAKKQRSQPLAEISSGQQHKKVVQQKFDEKTAQQSQSYPRRIQRTHSAIDKADSTVGGQNAQHLPESACPTEGGTVDAL